MNSSDCQVTAKATLGHRVFFMVNLLASVASIALLLAWSKQNFLNFAFIWRIKGIRLLKSKELNDLELKSKIEELNKIGKHNTKR